MLKRTFWAMLVVVGLLAAYVLIRYHQWDPHNNDLRSIGTPAS